MVETEYLAKIIRETPEIRGKVRELANRMLDEQTRLLGNQILDYLSGEWGNNSKEDGFGNDYVAMCYQTQYKKYDSFKVINDCIETRIFNYLLPYQLRMLYLDKSEMRGSIFFAMCVGRFFAFVKAVVA